MMKVNQLASAALCLSLLSLAACSKGGGGGGNPDSGPTTCSTSFDCAPLRDADGGTRTQVCISSQCVPTCTGNSQCAAGQVCEEGTCTAPGCGAASDCATGQICSGGTCTSAPTASSVASCVVTPNPAVVDQGKSVQLSVVGKDAAGKAVAFTGFTYNVSGPGAVSPAGLVTASGAGAITVTANAGNTSTCTATVNAYAANTTAGTLRAVVIDEFTKAPVVGATVAMSDSSKTTTDANGVATFTSVGAGPYNVHVFAANYDYFSLVGTSNTDVLIPLMPNIAASTRSGFQGTMNAADFAPLNIPNESVHLAFFGSGIPGSPIDIGVQTIVGILRPVTITLAGQTQQLNLPSGLVLGVSDNMFGTQQYKIYSEQGKRVLWGLGGNLNLTSVVGALGPVLSGGTQNLDIGSLLAQLLPLVGKLQAGQIVGVEPPANGANPTFQTQQVPLNTPLRLRATVKVPDLPKQDGKYLGAAVALGGALAYPLGFVPMGLTAGLANTDSSGANLPKVLDPTCDTSGGKAACATSNLPMKVAPLNNGLEGQPWGFVSLAANLSGLTGSGSSGGLALSGLVKPVAQVNYVAPPADGQAVDFTSRAFMNLPPTDSATLTKATRVLSLPAAIETSAKFVRIGVQAHSGLNWNVWMPANAAAATVTLPDPHLAGSTFTDPLADTQAADGTSGGPSSLLLHVSLASGTFADVSGFGNTTLDALGANVDAFTLITVKVQ
jgi:hypothetical protein